MVSDYLTDQAMASYEDYHQAKDIEKNRLKSSRGLR
jgi:hypothetical protein